jgi:hypothetical protein
MMPCGGKWLTPAIDSVEAVLAANVEHRRRHPVEPDVAQQRLQMRLGLIRW